MANYSIKKFRQDKHGVALIMIELDPSTGMNGPGQSSKNECARALLKYNPVMGVVQAASTISQVSRSLAGYLLHRG